MSTRNWLEENRERLLVKLSGVRAALERYIAQRGGDHNAMVADAPRAARPQRESSFALDLVVHRFGLSEFEQDLLLLAAGPELDGRFESLLAAAHGDSRGYATFSLALAALPGAHWSACTPAGPLRHWRLIELGTANALMTSALRIDERVLHYLVGTAHSDERLRGIIEPLSADAAMPAARATAASTLAHRWWHASARLPVLALNSADAELRRLMAAAVAEQVGIRLLAVRSDAIPAAADERVDLLRLLERECVLSDAALLIDQADAGTERAGERALAHALETLNLPVIVCSKHPPVLASRELVVAEVTPLSHAELRDAWRFQLQDQSEKLNGTLDRVVGQFRIGLGGIAAVASALRSAPDDDEPAGGVWDLCRSYARPRLDGLAERIEPVATWADLVVPVNQLEALQAIAMHARYRFTVQQQWGFANRSGGGQGITALFSGPSGTGKTMAAEVLANELKLDLYRIDLSQVVSKYIGETEKNLRRVFDAAEGGSAILLFDEADSLFGKRSEVKDSHDRYANIEVSYLLQRMDAYHGLAVLTTNNASAIDTAFLRRLRFAVTFPFPDAGARTEIWRRAFPAAAPIDGLDLQRLGRLNVAGGNIRSIALHAAFFAASAAEPIRMPHLLRAARLEYAKLERPLSDAELGGWT